MDRELEGAFEDVREGLLSSIREAIRIPSFSDEEGELAAYLANTMRALGFDGVSMDKAGNVIGRVGDGGTIVQFDSHMDTVRVHDEAEWTHPPFSGDIAEGHVWGRGSVDMKSALFCSVYGAALAKRLGYLDGKTVCVTGTVCEEYCDGVNLQLLYEELKLRPDCCVICEPSDNTIALGHTGKAQVRITAHGVSAHGSAPEKGKNAVYEMAPIIARVEALNARLSEKGKPHGTIVLSDIACDSVSLNAVPSSCSIYLDRRLTFGETLAQVRREMDELVTGRDADWEVGTLRRTTWKGAPLVYEPMHEPWRTDEGHDLTGALVRAYEKTSGKKRGPFSYWDFGTNAVTPIALGIPVAGFGPGDSKLAHMRDERCRLDQIEEACKVYAALIREL